MYKYNSEIRFGISVLLHEVVNPHSSLPDFLDVWQYQSLVAPPELDQDLSHAIGVILINNDSVSAASHEVKPRVEDGPREACARRLR